MLSHSTLVPPFEMHLSGDFVIYIYCSGHTDVQHFSVHTLTCYMTLTCYLPHRSRRHWPATCMLQVFRLCFGCAMRETSVDSATQLTLGSDFFKTNLGGMNYTIYATPKLFDNWAECNGQTVTDPESNYYGQTLPDLNRGTPFIETSIPVTWIMRIKEKPQ